MKIKVLISSLISFLLIAGVYSCVKEYDLESVETYRPAPKELINAHLYGRILDESGNVISNATVTLHAQDGENVVTTNDRGQFEFVNARLLGHSAFVSVEKDGKFDAFRRWSAIKGKWNYTEIKMLEKKIVGTIEAGVGGQVETTEGALLQLPADAVVKQSGSAYNGIVNVAMQWIDPTAEDLTQRIVGDLSGIDIQGEEVALGTYGMMVVELQDNAGNELKIAEAKKATLTYPIPSDIHGDPPPTVPTWTYDEELGTWIEEGVAVKENMTYVAEVSHFSSWNVDWKGERIELSGNVTVNGQTGSILNSFQIHVESPVFGGVTGGFPANDGSFLFYNFPANESFNLFITNLCGQRVYQQSYGPFSQDTDIGTIDLDASSQSVVTISGTALDCNNAPLSGGYVQIIYEEYSIYVSETDANGEFEFTAPYCGSPVNASVRVIDIENQKGSMSQSFTIEGNDVDVGDIAVCDEPEEFVSIIVEDTIDVFFVAPQDFIGIRNSVSNSTIEAEGSGHFQIKTTQLINATGTYQSDLYSLYYSGGPNQLTYWPVDPPDMTVEVTEYSDVPGEFIRGNFTGTLRDSFQVEQPIIGEFKIEVE